MTVDDVPVHQGREEGGRSGLGVLSWNFDSQINEENSSSDCEVCVELSQHELEDQNNGD